MRSKPEPARVSVLLLAAFAITQPVAMNVFVPSLPGVATDLGASLATVQLTVSVYLLVFAVVQLLYGPLSDRFGRRPVLAWALALLVVGSAVCAVAPSIGWLILGRAAQAAGACGGMVLARAVLRDVHGLDGTARGLGVMTALVAGASAFAPAIGGLLDVTYGWRAGFVAVGGLAVVLLLLAIVALRETNVRSDRLHLFGVLGAAGRLVRAPAFIGYNLHGACTMGAWMCIVTGYPHVMSTLLDLPATEYGRWFPLPTAGYIIGNLVTVRAAGRVHLDQLVLVGSFISLAAVVALLALAWTGELSPLMLFAPVAVMVLGMGMSQQSAIAAAVSIQPTVAGSASGIIGFSQMLLGACAAQTVSLVLGDSVVPLVLMVLAFAVGGLVSGRFAAVAASRTTQAGER